MDTYRLRAAILAVIEPEISRACAVSALLAAGHRKSEIASLLELSPGEMNRAIQTLRSAAEHLDAGDASAPGA